MTVTMSPSWWPFHHIHIFHHHDHDHDHQHQKLHQEHQDDDPTVTSDESNSLLSERSSSVFDSTHSSSSSCFVNKDEHQQQRMHRRRCHVSFYPQVTQYDHIHRSDYTSEERHKTWYYHYELHRIHKDNQRTIHWMISFNQGRQDEQQVEEEEYCCRGLEYKTPTGIRARYQRQLNAMEATIKYQYHEWDYNKRSPCVEAMAKIYRQYTQTSVNIARMAGQIDYEYVLRNNSEESNITASSTTTPTVGNKPPTSISSPCTTNTSPVAQQQQSHHNVTPPMSPAAAA